MFKFSDGTGKIQGRINLTGGKMPAFADGINFETSLNSYYFVVFKPRFADNEKKFYIQMIKPVTNYNIISKHFSDVILSTLIRRRNWTYCENGFICLKFGSDSMYCLIVQKVL